MQIAKNGIGTTRPNPSVGAVIVHQDKIISEGFTSNYGGNHAEVNAINHVKNKSLLQESTIYVTLEPCSHFGKTPPCADLIVKHQFKQVVIGCLDDNPLVAGKGVQKLEAAGIKVISGVLEDECKAHHKRFITVQNKKRPYIILKWAETQNGFVAPIKKEKQSPVWISNTYSQQLVHKWRVQEHAILVGTNTVIADNPNLNVRTWSGNNPLRIVLDQNLRIPINANVYNNKVKTIFITGNNIEKVNVNIINENEKSQIFFEEINFQQHVAEEICSVLHKHKIQSVIIEGGTQTLQTFIDANLWDETRLFKSDVNIKEGVKAPQLKGRLVSKEKIKNDTLKVYLND
ncbi:bifunctional diaminohydroxyphosphoribosylaminopyrimidine deaminase/5-amino-6-(5-phosphoribosylamino)uracil reductase RibD [Polaribacter porphyrae]|uniref:bifunctional diaminohydroxyphosphoribosylaminopyrimidine deaminase/5-amino-6-(5-phosphoribosylamino)uracil reductase RibD n=1 Tax=Polaribacter porphyrae TaxID=1137780 RepID=UPI001FD319AC